MISLLRRPLRGLLRGIDTMIFRACYHDGRGTNSTISRVVSKVQIPRYQEHCHHHCGGYCWREDPVRIRTLLGMVCISSSPSEFPLSTNSWYKSWEINFQSITGILLAERLRCRNAYKKSVMLTKRSPR